MKYDRLILLLLLIGVLVFGVSILQQGSLTKQIATTLKKYNPQFQGVLYTQLMDDRILTFYRVGPNEFSFGILKESTFGLRVIRGGGNTALYWKDAITWTGAFDGNEQFGLLYGAVQAPEVTQIIVISESGRAATIVEDNGLRFWFMLLESAFQDPLTIRATDQTGKVLYEHGFVDYWEKRPS